MVDFRKDLLGEWLMVNGSLEDTGSNLGFAINNGATPTDNYNGIGSAAYDFNGTSNWIDLGRINNGVIPATFSTSLWFKKDQMNYPSGSGEANLFGIQAISEGAGWQYWKFGFHTNYPDKLIHHFGNGASSGKGIYGNETINNTDWYHCVITRNGATPRMYLNGIEVPTTTWFSQGTPSGIITSNFTTKIGTVSSQIDYKFDGKIADVKCWGRELTPIEVTELYQSSNNIRRQLVGEWLLQGTGSDTSTGNHNLTIYGSPAATTNRHSVENKAYQFTTTGSTYMSAGTKILGDTDYEFTIAAWIKSDGQTQTCWPLSQGIYEASAFNGYAFAFQYGNNAGMIDQFSFFNNNSGADWGYTNFKINMVTNTDWHFYVATKRGTTAPITTTYTDGVLQEQKSWPSALVTSPTTPFVIGREHQNNGPSWKGKISDVRVWKRVLSEQEINQLYDTPPTGVNLRKGLRQEILMNGNLNDTSGNGRTAVNNGGTLTTDKYGKTDRAYNFTGGIGGPYIKLEDARSINDVSNSFWIKRNTISANDELILGTYADPAYWFIRIMPAGANQGFAIWLATSAGVYRGYYTGEIVDTNWHHVVMTRTGVTIKLYVDGIEKALILWGQGGTPSGAVNTGAEFWAGRVANIAGYYNLDGKLCDYKSWDRVLSANEVHRLYTETQDKYYNLYSGLINYWPLQGDYKDVIGTNHGTLMSGTPTFIPNHLGQENAAILIPATSYIEVGTPQKLQTFSISMWVKTASWTTANWQIAYTSAGYKGWGIIMETGGPTGGFKCKTYNGVNDSVDCAYLMTNLPINQWVHATWTISGTMRKMFINGKEVYNTNATSNIDNTQVGNMRFGNNDTNIPVNMSNVMYWNRILTNKEVEELYSITNRKGFIDPVSTLPQTNIGSSLSFHAPLNEGTGQTINDISSNANTGTLTGGTWVKDATGNNVLQFNGTSNIISMSDNSNAFDFGANDFTMSVWAYRITSTGCIAARDDTIYSAWLFGFNGTTRPVFYASSNNSTWDLANNLSMGFDNGLNQWNHYVVTRKSNVLYTYCNGKLVTSIACTGTFAFL